VAIAGEEGGMGPPVVLLHGLTATRRYVTMGSRLLERRGYRLIAYDARGHGESGPAPDRAAYEYRDLMSDLGAVLEGLEVGRTVLVGSSMGAATAVAYALDAPERVAALVLSTPAYRGAPHDDPAEALAWEALADGLEVGGVEGFMEAVRFRGDPRWRDSFLRLTRQRLERHRHPAAVANALRVVPRSAAFEGLEALQAVRAPTLVVASRDEADPEHPLAVAEAYVERLPDAELAVEEPGRPPLAWRGSQLSRTIADFLERRVPDFASVAEPPGRS
ncbi:MAG TPA: alpha/beta hydrolase, partial [Thermoleophilaceae bacterium]|nr:alpha/beta hydrolase [Thermoleophilaceae bacterium]